MPEAGPRRKLGDRWRRFFATPEQLEAEDREERSRQSGAQPISEARVRDAVVLQGTVDSMTTSPHTGWLTARLDDGTGAVTLVWMGRRRLLSVIPGTHLLVRGRLTRQDDELVIFNPQFEVLP